YEYFRAYVLLGNQRIKTRRKLTSMIVCIQQQTLFDLSDAALAPHTFVSFHDIAKTNVLNRTPGQQTKDRSTKDRPKPRLRFASSVLPDCEAKPHDASKQRQDGSDNDHEKKTLRLPNATRVQDQCRNTNHRRNEREGSNPMRRFALGRRLILHPLGPLLIQLIRHSVTPPSHPSHTETPDYSIPNPPSHGSFRLPDNSCRNSGHTSTSPRASPAPRRCSARADSPSHSPHNKSPTNSPRTI